MQLIILYKILLFSSYIKDNKYIYLINYVYEFYVNFNVKGKIINFVVNSVLSSECFFWLILRFRK